ncbi:BnaCnng57940D [Brassica napus]|uniref:BnaCnng57940D protein n=1 Tax=Brassica napus TaxID=3708 RepID=A0A078JL02_BRANA|nr:BnaCnng57940D [Brassica napus]
MKRLKKSGALNLPQDLHKFELCKPMDGDREGSVSINPFLSRSSWCFHVYKYVVLGSRAP